MFGSKVRPEVFASLLKGEISVNELAKRLNVSVATLLTCIAPLLPYRVVNMSLSGGKSIALGHGIPANEETRKLVDELAKDVAKTRKTIKRLAREIAESENQG